MERHIARINGIKTNLTRLSDEELVNARGYAESRLWACQDDIHELDEERFRRGGQLVLDIADTALSGYAEIADGLEGMGGTGTPS